MSKCCGTCKWSRPFTQWDTPPENKYLACVFVSAVPLPLSLVSSAMLSQQGTDCPTWEAADE